MEQQAEAESGRIDLFACLGNSVMPAHTAKGRGGRIATRQRALSMRTSIGVVHMAEPSIATCALDQMIGVYTLTFTWQHESYTADWPLSGSTPTPSQHRSIAASQPACYSPCTCA